MAGLVPNVWNTWYEQFPGGASPFARSQDPFDQLMTIPGGFLGQGAATFPGGFVNKGQWTTQQNANRGFGGGMPSGGFAGGGGGFGGFGGGNTRAMFGGGGNINFNAMPEGYNPYQFMPAVSDFYRPEQAFLGLSPEEEYLRQYQMGQLLGARPGEDLAFNQLMATVGGAYLSPESNPFLGANINALSGVASDATNSAINEIISRAGTGGALGGSRAQLTQAEAAGDINRNLANTVANMLNENYARERGLQLNAIQPLLTTEQLPTERTAQAYQLAGIPRAIEQQNVSFNIGEWLRQQQERLLPAQVAQSVLGQHIGQAIPIVQQPSNMLGSIGSLLTGGANALGGLNGLFGGGQGGGGIGGLLSRMNPFSMATSMGGFVDPFAAVGGTGGFLGNMPIGLGDAFGDIGSFILG